MEIIRKVKFNINGDVLEDTCQYIVYMYKQIVYNWWNIRHTDAHCVDT